MQSLKPAPPVAAPEAKPFDPFAFSLVVVLTKDGRDGLMQELEAIESEADLRALAKAQHIPIPADLDAVRSAITVGTAERIADRRAAAS